MLLALWPDATLKVFALREIFPTHPAALGMVHDSVAGCLYIVFRREITSACIGSGGIGACSLPLVRQN
jgi:hypothetical protein